MKKILLLLFFLFSCTNEYTIFHNEKELIQTKNNLLEEQLKEFNFEKIKYLPLINIKETPDLNFLDDLVKKIDNSKQKVYVEVYIFTEKRLRQALIDAKKRGVDVKVILEKNIYLAGNLNKATFDLLKKSKIDIVYSDSKDYSLNHTKMMFIDDTFFISTGNYSYSTFKYNREFFIYGKNKELYDVLSKIYSEDFIGNKTFFYQDNLVLSPYFSRSKIEFIIKNAKKNLKIYVHNFGDKSIINLIIEAKKRGVDIEIIFPSLKKVESNKDEIELLKKEKIKIKQLEKPEIHAKSILVDEKYLYIGSVNFSQQSMDKNREIGLLISNEEIINYYLKLFNTDFNNKN